MLKYYLKEKQKPILLFVSCTLIFYIVFMLYNLPINAVLYAFLLCSIVLLPTFCYDYIQYVKKYKAILLLEKTISISIDLLPPPQGIIEDQYHNLLKNLYKEYQLYISKTTLVKTEMIDFYGLWVHQIKTPISAISLLLQMNHLSEYKQISQELFKIEQYTELVLGYLRIDDISKDLILKECNIDKIIKESIKKYAIIFIHKKIMIDRIDSNQSIITDEKWLIFVIEQLLSNALKYTNTGTIKIYLDGFNLMIQDTGIGIRPEDLPRIFEKSFTGFNGRIHKKSTGLGLYLCKKILTKLNHTITITSKQDIGTKVIIDLSQSNIIHE